MLADLCIYTIRHSDDLRDSIKRGGSDTFTEGKNWARAKQLLDEARKQGKRLPIVFAPAEDTRHLFAWALLEEVLPSKTTSFTFSQLRPFKKRPRKTSLRRARDGQPLDGKFIKPYAICRTPTFLLSLDTADPRPDRPYPDELRDPRKYPEGAHRRVEVNAYERNERAKRACIAHYGLRCCVCGIDFAAQYGEIGAGIIHVHHLKPLSEIGGSYEVDPIKDLRPVCPNCHAVIHWNDPPLSIEELRTLVRFTFSSTESPGVMHSLRQ